MGSTTRGTVLKGYSVRKVESTAMALQSWLLHRLSGIIQNELLRTEALAEVAGLLSPRPLILRSEVGLQVPGVLCWGIHCVVCLLGVTVMPGKQHMQLLFVCNPCSSRSACVSQDSQVLKSQTEPDRLAAEFRSVPASRGLRFVWED